MPRRSGRRPQDHGTPDRTPSRRPLGRPPIVADDARVTALLDAIRAGVPIRQACLHAGIPPSAHFRAMAQAETADQAAEAGQELPDRADAYRDYRDRVDRARASVAVVHVSLLGRAARGGQVIRETTRTLPDGTVEQEVERARPEWRASTWLLERSFREDFGKDAQRVELTGPDGGPVETTSGPADDALSTIAERLAQVAEAQRSQLPGGWPAPARAIGPAVREDLDDGAPVDAELVDEDGPAR